MRTFSTSSKSDVLSSFEQLTISSASGDVSMLKRGGNHIALGGTPSVINDEAATYDSASYIESEFPPRQPSRQPLRGKDVRAWTLAHAHSAIGPQEWSSDGFPPAPSSALDSEFISDDFSDTDSDVTATFSGSRYSRGRRIQQAEDDDTESLMSVKDARSSIDAFMAKDPVFMSDKSNKLRLWQALCIEEFGLCQPTPEVPDLPDLPSYLTGVESPSSSRSSTPTGPRIVSPTSAKAYHPLPQTLTSANKLLKQHAHVNLVDYLVSRGSGTDDYSHLVHPSRKAMRDYTIGNRRFVRLAKAKGEWLQPLLQDFTVRRRR